MIVDCEKALLEKSVLAVQRATAVRTTLPILNNILIETTNNMLRLYATDLEIGIEKIIEANIIQEGKIVTSAKILSELLPIINTDKISIQLIKEKNLLNLKSKNFNYDLATLPPEEFPQPYKIEKEYDFEIKKDVLKDMIKKTVWAAASISEARIPLTGVLLEIEGNTMKFVATDAHRLVIREKELVNKKQKDIRIIIPARALNELLRIIPDEIDTIYIIIDKNQIIFRMNNTILTSRLIDGQFPPYQNAIQQIKVNTKWLLNTHELLRAIKGARVFAKEDTNIIKLNSENNKLYINASTQDVGYAEEIIDIEKEGKDITVFFNVNYLIDILNNIEDNKTLILLTQEDMAVLIRPADDEKYIYIIMPIAG